MLIASISGAPASAPFPFVGRARIRKATAAIALTGVLAVAISGLATYSGEAWRELKAFGRWVGHEFAAGWSAAQRVAQATWSAITRTIGDTWAGVKGLISNLGGAITGWLSGLLGWVRQHLIPGFMDGPQSLQQRQRHPAIGGVSTGWSPVVPPAHMIRIDLHNHTHLDGRQIAESTAKHLNRAMGHGSHVGRHDPNATLPPAGLGYA